MSPTTAGAALGILGGITSGIGGIFSANKAKEAAEKDMWDRIRANEMQKQWQEMLMGGQGSPVFLPLYGKNLEQRMFNEAESLYNQTGFDAASRLQAEQARIGRFIPTAENIMLAGLSGATGAQRLQSFVPVEAARTAGAEATAQAFEQAAARRANEILAQRTAAGYSGTGLPIQRQLLAGQFDANRMAATERAGAAFANAQERAAIEEQNRTMQLALAGQMPTMVSSLSQLESLPAASVAQQQAVRMGLFQPFDVDRTAWAGKPLAWVLPGNQAISVEGYALDQAGKTMAGAGGMIAAMPSSTKDPEGVNKSG